MSVKVGFEGTAQALENIRDSLKYVVDRRAAHNKKESPVEKVAREQKEEEDFERIQGRVNKKRAPA